MKLSFIQKIVAGFIVACVFLMALGIYSYYHSIRYIESSKLVSHTHKVLFQVEEVLASAIDVETGQRGFIITGNEGHLEPFYNGKRLVRIHLAELYTLIQDSPDMIRRYDSLTKLIDHKISYSEARIQERRNDSMAFAPGMGKFFQNSGKLIMDSVRQVVKGIQIEQNKLLAQRLAVTEQQESMFNATFNVMLASVALILTAGCVLIIRNTKARTSVEQQILAQARKLEQSNKDLEAFTYSVSHDLRAPLRSINGYTQILKEDYAPNFDTDGRILLDIIMNNSRKMGALIDDLLSFSRVGRIDITRSKINVNQLVDGIVKELLNTDSDSAQIQISIGKLPDCYADLTMLNQVWVNLISNAIKYSSQKEIALIEISGKVDNNEVIYQVKDNGIGFDMKFAHKLFGVFQRLHKMDEFEGTGVGLSIVHRIIDRHGGRVWAEGKINEGALFGFALPDMNFKNN